MGIIYIITVIALIVSFILFKKSEKKQNIITWLILSIICYLAYNIFVCMFFGSLNLHTNLLFLSVVNLIVSVALFYLVFKKNLKQEYYLDKTNILPVIFIIGITLFVGITQYKPFEDSIATASVDGAMHYSASANFSNNMIILSKIDNQTGYNFLTMQTGAYINTGIAMNVARSIIGENVKQHITFKACEIFVYMLSILSIYMLVADKMKTKFSFVICMMILGLYAFGYPYTSLLYGFSYLSISLVFCSAMFHLANLYEKKEVNFIVQTVLIVLIGIAIIFSYCLFVPAMFAFICISVFVNNKNDKHKLFKKETMIITGLLLLVTILGILYLVLPTFLVSTQNKLTDAIGFEGEIYRAFYNDFIIYVPFVIVLICKNIKDNKFSNELIAFLITLIQIAVLLIGLVFGKVSSYYYYKMYYLMFVILIYIAMQMLCEYSHNIEMQTVLGTIVGVFTIMVLLTVTGLERKVHDKFPYIIRTVKCEQYAGIYFDINIVSKPNIELSCTVNADRLALARELGKHKEITLKNMLVGGMNAYCKSWLYVISENSAGGESINDLQMAVVENTTENFLEAEEKEYFVLFTGDKFESNEDYEVMFQNDAGVILKKK